MRLILDVRAVHPETDVDTAFQSDWTRPLGYVEAKDGQGRTWFLLPKTQEELDEFAKAFVSEVGMDRPGKPGQEE